MNEIEIINSLLPKITNKEFLKNDTFLLDKFIITNDILVENVHFFSDSNPKTLAKKALRVNLSDIASMGCKPIGYFLGLVLNDETKKKLWLEEFISGLGEDHEKYEIQLFGGDTVIHHGALMISVTMIGEKNNNYKTNNKANNNEANNEANSEANNELNNEASNRVLSRSGARPGDIICVSGNIGDAYLGLLSYQKKIEDNMYFKVKYDLPDPKIDLGIIISKFATACIDISDGLLHDANHIAVNSSVMMEINIDKVPFSYEAKSLSNFTLDLKKGMITGGDDYELLFTVPERIAGEIEKLSAFQIGVVREGSGITVIDDRGDLINTQQLGFMHK